MKTFVVIGLGRFGSAVALELSELGHEVLAVDIQPERVQAVADQVTHCVVGDARDPEVLRSLGARNFDCAVAAASADVGVSALIVLNLKELGVTAVYFGPVFQSTRHGYDTADYYRVDSRLGDNDSFAKLCDALHQNGIRVVLDGEFNHVGRDFWAFQDVQKNGQSSPYCGWFHNLNFGGPSPMGDPFWYDSWQGHYELVKLNLRNPAVIDYLLDAVRMWKRELSVDGLRLDVLDPAHCDAQFLGHRLLRGLLETGAAQHLFLPGFQQGDIILQTRLLLFQIHQFRGNLAQGLSVEKIGLLPVVQGDVRRLVGDMPLRMSCPLPMGKLQGVDHFLLRDLHGVGEFIAQNGDLTGPLVVGIQQMHHMFFHISIHHI